MSTSYTKFILFLLGIIISSPAFADDSTNNVPDPGDSGAYLDCSPKDGGVPVGVVILGLPALEKKDKEKYIDQIIAKENKSGKLQCVAAAYPFSEAQTHCPIGQFADCAKNSVESKNPNSPHPLRADAPRGTEHGYIEVSEDDAKHGLKGALEREGFYKKDFADPFVFPHEYFYYSGAIQSSAPPENYKGEAAKECMAYNATEAWNCGRSFYEVQVGSAPAAPAVAIKEPEAPPAPTEVYDGGKAGDCDSVGNYDCAKARACLNDTTIFAETCGGPDCLSPTLYSCLGDYNKFCSADGSACGSGQSPTTVAPPANLAANAKAAADAIEALKAATLGMKDNSGKEIQISKCGLFGVMIVPPPGAPVPTIQTQPRYTECLKDNNDPSKGGKMALRVNDLDYLEKLLKAFSNPASAKPPYDMSGISSQAFLVALGKLGSTDGATFFTGLNVPNPRQVAIDAYNNLAAALAPVGKAGALDGSIIEFAQKTDGGKGYLGVVAPTQSSSGGRSYKDVISSIDSSTGHLSCLKNPSYTDDANKLQAIVHDRNLALKIKAVVESPACSSGGANAKPGGANAKPGKTRTQ